MKLFRIVLPLNYDGYYEHLETVINAELGMNGYSDEDVVSVSFPHSRLCIIAAKVKRGNQNENNLYIE